MIKTRQCVRIQKKMQFPNTKGWAQIVGYAKVRAEERFERCESRQGECVRVRGGMAANELWEIL